MSKESDVWLFRRLWRLLGVAQRRRFLRLQCLSFVMAISTLLGLTAVVPFLGVCAEPSLIERTPALARLYAALDFSSASRFVVFLGIAFVLLTCVGNAVNLLGAGAIRRFAHELSACWQQALFDEYLHRDTLFHARSDSAALASRVVRHVDGCALGILHGFLVLFTSVLTSVFILISVLLLNPGAALLAAVMFGGCYAAIYLAVRRRLLINGRVQAQRWSERARLMSESLGAIKEILIVGNQDFLRRAFARQGDSIARSAADTVTIAQFPRNVIECVAAAALVGAALWLGSAGHSRWVAELTFFALAAYRLIPALQQGFAAIAHIGAESPLFDAVAADLQASLERPAPSAESESMVAEWRGRPRREIRLEQVNFRYAPQLPLAIRDLSLRIPAGARVALVGANGSGKTTLADLITGLIAPESGAIWIDGERLEPRSRRAWQANIAYLPQTVVLQNASVAENIAFGIPRAEIDLARVHAVARQAQLEALIDSFPNGYDEPLGERGVRVSGGQRQLIGIARALYRGTHLLVLDESTSALDALNERRVIAALRADIALRTTIVIAHHPAALQECDFILELEHGALAAHSAASWPRSDAR